MAEAVKVGLIRDAAFLHWLVGHAYQLAGFAPDAVETMIRRCAELHLAHIATGRASVLQSVRVVMRKEFRSVVTAHMPLDPLCHLLVSLGTRHTGDLAVCDVPHQDVAERVLKLSLHRRPALTAHKLLALEPSDGIVKRRCIPVGGQRTRPKHLPDDRGVLQ